MILDEKVIMYPPPPPYLSLDRVASSRSRSSVSSSTGSTRTHVPHNPQANLSALPAHILLQVIHHCFPSDSDSGAHVPFLAPPLSNSITSTASTSQGGPAQGSSSSSNASSSAAAAAARYYLEHLRLSQPSTPEKQRKTLYWLATSLRLVSRSLYTACMHVLRSTYLPAYLGMIRPGYSSDPFPMGVPVGVQAMRAGRAGSVSSTGTGPPAYESYPPSPSPSLPAFPSSQLSPTSGQFPPPSPSTPYPPSPSAPSSSYPHHQPQPPILTPHRETPILDLFIALKVRQDVLADESELHLDREDSFRDLFEVAQPRARLEDLVREVGGREGVVWVGQGVRGYDRNASLISLTPPQTPVKASVEEEEPVPVPSSSTQTRISAQAPSHPPTPKTRRSLFSSLPFMSTSSSPSSASNSKRSSPQSTTPVQSHSASPSPQPRPQPIPFSSLSVSFSPRRVGLVLNKTKTIAEVQRMGNGRQKEPLESLAERLVGEVKRCYGY